MLAMDIKMQKIEPDPDFFMTDDSVQTWLSEVVFIFLIPNYNLAERLYTINRAKYYFWTK